MALGDRKGVVKATTIAASGETKRTGPRLRRPLGSPLFCDNVQREGEPLRRQDDLGLTEVYRRGRHHKVTGADPVLRHGEPAAGLDGAQPVYAGRQRSAQNDSDAARSVAPIVRDFCCGVLRRDRSAAFPLPPGPRLRAPGRRLLWGRIKEGVAPTCAIREAAALSVNSPVRATRPPTGRSKERPPFDGLRGDGCVNAIQMQDALIRKQAPKGERIQWRRAFLVVIEIDISVAAFALPEAD